MLIAYLVEVAACACPLGIALVDEEYLLAYVAYRAHIVCVDDGGDTIFVGDVADEAVDDA